MWLAPPNTQQVLVIFNGHRRESGNKIKQLEGELLFVGISCEMPLPSQFVSAEHIPGTKLTAQLSSLTQELYRLLSLSANRGKFPELWGQCGKGLKIKFCSGL